MRTFEDLDVWKRSCQLAVTVYGLLKNCKHIGIRNQMQRSAVSIPSNIAEGYERGGKDFMRFLNIARGSAAELRTQCYLLAKITPRSDLFPVITELKEISKMLTGLSNSIKRSLQDSSESKSSGKVTKPPE